jgi:hypothetical protein
VASRRSPAVILIVTLLVLGMGAVRGYLAAKARPERYPCSFEKKSGNTWRGGLSLDDAQKLERKAAVVGKRVVVRLRHINRDHAVSTIKCVARAYGMDPAPFLAVAECETHVTPDDNIYQYIPSTWASSSPMYGHAGADESDAYANIHVTVQKVKHEGWGPWSCKP